MSERHALHAGAVGGAVHAAVDDAAEHRRRCRRHPHHRSEVGERHLTGAAPRRLSPLAARIARLLSAVRQKGSTAAKLGGAMYGARE
eukprot:gene5778-biopygen13476